MVPTESLVRHYNNDQCLYKLPYVAMETELTCSPFHFGDHSAQHTPPYILGVQDQERQRDLAAFWGPREHQMWSCSVVRRPAVHYVERCLVVYFHYPQV